MQPGSLTGSNLTIVRDGLTNLTCELKRKLTIKTPGAALVWAMPLKAVAPAKGTLTVKRLSRWLRFSHP